MVTNDEAREALAWLIHDFIVNVGNVGDGNIGHLADGILAAGWTPPVDAPPANLRSGLIALIGGEDRDAARRSADRILAAYRLAPVDAPPRYQAVVDARRDAEGQMDTLREVVRRRRNLPPAAGDVREAAARECERLADMEDDPDAMQALWVAAAGIRAIKVGNRDD